MKSGTMSNAGVRENAARAGTPGWLICSLLLDGWLAVDARFSTVVDRAMVGTLAQTWYVLEHGP